MDRILGFGGVPFSVRELKAADAGSVALFQRAFGSAPPAVPRHFVAVLDSSESLVAGYLHFTVFEPDVYLCGGLCVDARLYRRLSARQRSRVASEGSLARWLSREAIAALGRKKAVFAYTGDDRSRRDALALGFVPIDSPFLLVQWHDLPETSRAGLVKRVAAQGPF